MKGMLSDSILFCFSINTDMEFSTNLHTNVIQNVINLGGTSACDNQEQWCTEGYALYVPCLKDITRGQSACFEFYVADIQTKDVTDLRHVDDIDLELTGLYGCSFGVYSYPEDISSLQVEEYVQVYEDDFNQNDICHLSLCAFDGYDANIDLYINNKEGDFYENTVVEVSAEDTYEYIFVGWTLPFDDSEECPTETLEDYIISRNKKYSFRIKEDMKLYAVYRLRKTYKVVVDPDNVSSHYDVTYQGVEYHLSNREEIDYDDGCDYLEVLEGYTMLCQCIPNTYYESGSGTIYGCGNPDCGCGEDSDSDVNVYTYRFIEWKDGNTERCRFFRVGFETGAFEKDDEIRLFSMCEGPVEPYELDNVNPMFVDGFDKEGIHLHTENSVLDGCPFIADDYIISAENSSMVLVDGVTYLYCDNGSLTLVSGGIEDDILVTIDAMPVGDSCSMSVTINGASASVEVSSNDRYSFKFDKCDFSNIDISIEGEIYIGKIEVLKLEIKDKGKAQLCLEGEDTYNFYTGDLYMSGSIYANGNGYGLAKTKIGSVNRLDKIKVI